MDNKYIWTFTAYERTQQMREEKQKNMKKIPTSVLVRFSAQTLHSIRLSVVLDHNE